jgi:hypothetical protein
MSFHQGGASLSAAKGVFCEVTTPFVPYTGHGVWRQAVDRYGKDLQKDGVSSKRKGNFHRPRCLMMNLLSLQRMMDHAGKPTAFPE